MSSDGVPRDTADFDTGPRCGRGNRRMTAGRIAGEATDRAQDAAAPAPCPLAGTGTAPPTQTRPTPRGEPWREADGLHIDVRGLPPPQPLVAILRLVEASTDATPLTVHHDRDPQLLYPELAERGWVAERIDGDAGEFRLRLRRVG